MPAQVEQEAEELNRIRRKLVMRVEVMLEQEYKASRVRFVFVGGGSDPVRPGITASLPSCALLELIINADERGAN